MSQDSIPLPFESQINEKSEHHATNCNNFVANQQALVNEEKCNPWADRPKDLYSLEFSHKRCNAGDYLMLNGQLVPLDSGESDKDWILG